MPDWLAPFHRPKMTSEEFKKMKAKYIAKHGYTMTVPGLRDIIMIGVEKSLDEGEVKAWRRKDWKYFSPERYEEIKKMKQKRKDKFLTMLASPTPHIIQNAGSIMTSIDDAQDALGTLAWIGMLAVKAAPRFLGPFLGGPIGWTMTAADTLNTVQRCGYKKIPRLETQSAMHWAEHNSAQPRKVRVKKAINTMKWTPHSSRVVEGLQTSGEVFGIGITLGALVGFGIESVTGPYRRVTGAKVKVKVDWPVLQHFTMKAQREARSSLSYIGSGLQTDDDEVMMMTAAHYLARQELLVGMKDWNAMENVEDPEEIELKAPVPENILTQEVLQEEGIGLEERIGWPHNNKPWSLVSDLINELDRPCQDFQRDFFELHKTDWLAYVFCGLNNDATCYTFATAEGEDQIIYDYAAAATVAAVMSHFGIYPALENPKNKMREFADQIDIWEARGIRPTLRDITDFCENKDILLTKFDW